MNAVLSGVDTTKSLQLQSLVSESLVSMYKSSELLVVRSSCDESQKLNMLTLTTNSQVDIVLVAHWNAIRKFSLQSNDCF